MNIVEKMYMLVQDSITYGLMCLDISAASYEHHGVSNHRQLELLVQQFVKAKYQENIKLTHYWPFGGEPSGDLIPRTNGQ